MLTWAAIAELDLAFVLAIWHLHPASANGLVLGRTVCTVLISASMAVVALQLLTTFLRSPARWLRNTLDALSSSLVVIPGLLAVLSAISYLAGPWILLGSGAVANYGVLYAVRRPDAATDREMGESR